MLLQRVNHRGRQGEAGAELGGQLGGPLGEGRLHDHAIACPRHGAKFDIRTGQPLTMPATVPTVVHEVRVEGEDVYVRINEA